jgi:hypothetical protein
MSSEPMRDPRSDAFRTPANSALVVIDYQPDQLPAVVDIVLTSRLLKGV